MKSRAAIEGHPIHPMLVSFPIGFFAGSLAFDAAGALTDSPKLKDTGYHLMLAGLVSGAAAAVPGIVDYLTVIPPESDAENTAQTHALSNIGVMALFGANAVLRAKKGPMAVSLLLSGAACGLMVFAGWLGGTLVYQDQIAVDHLTAEGNEHVALPTREAVAGEFVSVCGTADLKKGQLGLLILNGERIVLARLEDDRFVAFADRCTHLGGPLSDGTLVGERVMCPWHGSEFNVCTGAVACGPAKDPIASYEVRVEGDRVLIKAPAAASSRSPIRAGRLG